VAGYQDSRVSGKRIEGGSTALAENRLAGPGIDY